MSSSTRKPFHETAPARLASIAADLRAGGQRAAGCARALEEMLGHITDTETPSKHLPAMIEAMTPVEAALRSKGFTPAATQVSTCLTELRRLIEEAVSPAVEVDRTLDEMRALGPHGAAGVVTGAADLEACSTELRPQLEVHPTGVRA